MNSANEIGPSAVIRLRSRSASPATAAILLDQPPRELVTARSRSARRSRASGSSSGSPRASIPSSAAIDAADELDDRLGEA